MSRKKRDTPPIGTWVRFNHQVVVEHKENYRSGKRDYIRIPCVEDALSRYGAVGLPTDVVMQEGQVVGGKWLRRGVTERDYENGTYFTSTGPSYFVYLVRVGFTNKPLWVDPEDAAPIPSVELAQDTPELPFFYQHFSDYDRKALSDCMKEEQASGRLPRDENGKFRAWDKEKDGPFPTLTVSPTT